MVTESLAMSKVVSDRGVRLRYHNPDKLSDMLKSLRVRRGAILFCLCILEIIYSAYKACQNSITKPLNHIFIMEERDLISVLLQARSDMEYCKQIERAVTNRPLLYMRLLNNFTRTCIECGVRKEDLESFLKHLKANDPEMHKSLKKDKPAYIKYRGFYFLYRCVNIGRVDGWGFAYTHVTQIRVLRDTGLITFSKEFLFENVYNGVQPFKPLADKIILENGLSNKRWFLKTKKNWERPIVERLGNL